MRSKRGSLKASETGGQVVARGRRSVLGGNSRAATGMVWLSLTITGIQPNMLRLRKISLKVFL